MKKKFFEDPEMEVVRFDPRDIFTGTSGEMEMQETNKDEPGPDDEPDD